ncbi:MAG: glutamine-hydrolyzing carbamoyl-phosphate synthase small subunit [Gemmatimonadetes bacterium]|jgi:carbamoyl-phosphate synthase small subunit|nr:glutamine-hydrolyzing carbamoyl-phosphate synthase small subunit [Gemmatimonadota bacterium]MBT7863794.1 glutamine-hydrolyzing carbamoyl-phosphate synthase small subunit [Gemmatimonadota bacterium]
MTPPTRPALIALADGTTFQGHCVAGSGEVFGEMVFNTSMTGYQEILTDPSYAGQMVTMTYPHIGNYGVTPEDDESSRPHVRAFVMKQCCRRPSNQRATSGLVEYMEEHGVIGVEDIDTRQLVRHVRTEGAMNAAVSTTETDPEALVERARAWEGLEGRDMAGEVTCEETYVVEPESEARAHVVAYDFGIKRSIVRKLVEAGCRVTVVPARTSAQEALAHKPDGIFLSNGPGDPRPLDYAIATTRQLIETADLPMFGICLGHEILGLAFGAEIYKLKFGHRGANQPIKEHASDRILITSENHGWGVKGDSLPDVLEVTRNNLNDGCVEGFQHRQRPIFSIQCHPEASPGPHDSDHLFGYFAELMQRHSA